VSAAPRPPAPRDELTEDDVTTFMQAMNNPRLHTLAERLRSGFRAVMRSRTPPAGAAGAPPPAPSDAAIAAAFREGRQHGGSVRGAPGARLEHLCACGKSFHDDATRDGDDKWQLHVTACELRAAYAVDVGAARAAGGPEPSRDQIIEIDEDGKVHAPATCADCGAPVEFVRGSPLHPLRYVAPSGLPSVATLAEWLGHAHTMWRAASTPRLDGVTDDTAALQVQIVGEWMWKAAWLLPQLAGAP
jgi:hypothetical protein